VRYASRTKVPIAKSRMEIEQILQRYKADQFGTAMADSRAMVQFRVSNWMVRFVLPLPNKNEQDQRQRWRALCLTIKAKLEAVESKITSFETEFLPYIVLPSGQTFGEFAVPQLTELKEKGKMPNLDLIEDQTKR